jgi:hypothetical protein
MSSDQYTSQDPTRQYKSPDTDGDQIDYPGQTGAMHDKPDHGENSYRGSHRLDDRAAVITGGTPASVGPSLLPSPGKALM